MTIFQYVGIGVVLVILIVGLLGPTVLTLYLNILCDRYDALDREEPT